MIACMYYKNILFSENLGPNSLFLRHWHQCRMPGETLLSINSFMYIFVNLAKSANPGFQSKSFIEMRLGLNKPAMTPARDVLLQKTARTTGGKHGNVTMKPNNIIQLRSIPLAITTKPKIDQQIHRLYIVTADENQFMKTSTTLSCCCVQF